MNRGALIAAAVAGLFASATPFVASARQEANVKCQGVNDCKGKGSCKSAQNDCKGKNACKGKSFVLTSATKCEQMHGTVLPKEKTGEPGGEQPQPK